MPNTTPWREVRARRPINEQAAHRETLKITLAVLGERYGATQMDSADLVGTILSNVSERETSDLRLSTIARYIHVLDGRLELKAIFGDTEYVLLHDVSDVAA